MGIWEFIWSTTETVKTNTPDLAPVKNACRTSCGYGSAAVSKTVTPVKDACRISYDYGSAAFWKIDKAVRVDGLQKLKENMPDEIGPTQITSFASKFAQNAAHYALREAYKEAYKLVPGGEAMGKVVSKTIRDMKSENRNNQEMEAAKEATGASGKTSSSRDVQFGHHKVISADQAPEDVLRIFMMKEFVGTRLLDDLIIPQKRHSKEPK